MYGAFYWFHKFNELPSKSQIFMESSWTVLCDSCAPHPGCRIIALPTCAENCMATGGCLAIAKGGFHCPTCPPHRIPCSISIHCFRIPQIRTDSHTRWDRLTHVQFYRNHAYVHTFPHSNNYAHSIGWSIVYWLAQLRVFCCCCRIWCPIKCWEAAWLPLTRQI